MCGIAGIYSPLINQEERLHQLNLMLDAQMHRGPDDVGVYSDEQFCSIGMRRLSIIDLANGKQPIFSEDGRYVLVYNGEVYNYLELRDELKYKSRFYTHCDSEVVLRMFEQFGVNSFKRLNGMFAISIWDKKTQTLYFARDRYGIKPLYFLNQGGDFRFASEINSLWSGLAKPKTISSESLGVYLNLGYLPSPYSLYPNVTQLMPGHFAIYKNGTLNTEAYWDYSQSLQNLHNAEPISKIRELIEKAIKLQLQADVPLGVFLSGGMDSAIIAAVAAKQSKSRIKTFTLGFKEKDFNETIEARAISKHINSDHHEFIIEPSMIESSLMRSLKHVGEPFGAWSIVLNDLISSFSREHVTVALAGHGGDELFAGYPTLTAYKILKQIKSVPYLINIIKHLRKIIPTKNGNLSLDQKLDLFLRGAKKPDLLHAFYSWKEIFNLNETSSGLEIYKKYFQELNNSDEINKLLNIDFRVFLEGSCLAATDRTSMAHSLEVRVPFLDNDLVDYARSLPGFVKFPNLKTKSLLRKAFQNDLPKQIITRKKTGFVMPESLWLKNELKPLMIRSLETLADSKIFSAQQLKAFHNIKAEHIDNRANHGRKLTTLISLGVWLEQR